MCLILQQARLVITWSQKLQERTVPSVQMLFSLCSHHVRYCSTDQKCRLAMPSIPMAGDTVRGRICVISAIVLVMSSRTCPRICHFSLLSPPPPLGPKVSSSLVWLPHSSLLWSRVALANHKPYMLLFPSKPLISSPLF